MRYTTLTYSIIGCAMEVHRILGPGFPEVMYHRALAKELDRMSIQFQREVALTVYYKQEEIGSLRADFLVEGKIILELKALMELDDSYFAQSINYLEAFGLDTGLLINFGGPSLEFKRLFNKNKARI